MTQNTHIHTHSTSRNPPRFSASPLRQIVESMVCLAIAVILFRTFQAEGYMISTGSMAPTLLGYHKQVVCPTCEFQFAHGVPEPKPGDNTYAEEFEIGDVPPEKMTGELAPSPGAVNLPDHLLTCPNCGQRSIDISKVPRNHGDQLLVHKEAYWLYDPERWEVIVFRNPEEPLQAYVKRILGLPGESIQVIGGDLYADGRLQRKGLSTQRAMRISVYDHDFEPKRDRAWQSRWVSEPGQVLFRRVGQNFRVDGTREQVKERSQHVAWLTYRHWIREGGDHVSRVKVSRDPNLAFLEFGPRAVTMENQDSEFVPLNSSLPLNDPFPLFYDPATQLLKCRGVLSEEWVRRLTSRTRDPELREAILLLKAQSHVAPVSDGYGYNAPGRVVNHHEVQDLMLSTLVTLEGGEGQLILQMAYYGKSYSCQFDLKNKTVQLWEDRKLLRNATLPGNFEASAKLVEMSVMDQQVLVALDGKLPFDPWLMEDAPSDLDLKEQFARKPIRIGSRGLSVQVNSLKVFRDVYYTRTHHSKHALDEPYQLGEDEFFMLGDNSPVSSDSRSWPKPAVPRHLVLGKPFLVHLPSRPGRVKIGNRTRHVRIPDFSKVRYIR